MGHRYSIDLDPDVGKPSQFYVSVGVGVLVWVTLVATHGMLKNHFPSLPLTHPQFIFVAVALAVLAELFLYCRRTVSFLKTMSPSWAKEQISIRKLVPNPHYIIHAFRNSFASLTDRVSGRILVLLGIGFLVSLAGIVVFVAGRQKQGLPPGLTDWLTLMMPMGEFLTVVLACVIASLFLRWRIYRTQVAVIKHIEDMYTTNAVFALDDGDAVSAEQLAAEQQAVVAEMQKQKAANQGTRSDDPFGADPFARPKTPDAGKDPFGGQSDVGPQGVDSDPFAPVGGDTFNSERDPFSG